MTKKVFPVLFSEIVPNAVIPYSLSRTVYVLFGVDLPLERRHFSIRSEASEHWLKPYRGGGKLKGPAYTLGLCSDLQLPPYVKIMAEEKRPLLQDPLSSAQP